MFNGRVKPAGQAVRRPELRLPHLRAGSGEATVATVAGSMAATRHSSTPTQCDNCPLVSKTVPT